MTEMESFLCKMVSFDDISKWANKLAKQIRDCNCRPTVIIGLTRGGWVPARLLCDELGVKKLYAVKTEHWGVTANPDGKALLTQELNTSVKGESVLIVDDITDTGESLKLALGHLTGRGAFEVKAATLLHITHSTMEPDFYAVEVPKEKWAWFIFPWNLNEDMRTLLPKTLYEPKTAPEIRKAFREQFKISVPARLIGTTLKDLEAMGKIKKQGSKWSRV